MIEQSSMVISGLNRFLHMVISGLNRFLWLFQDGTRADGGLPVLRREVHRQVGAQDSLPRRSVQLARRPSY
jgi:hypothetical protein